MKKKIIAVAVVLASTFLIYTFFSTKEKYIKKNQQVINCNDCLIRDEEEAIQLAEETLFPIYGKSKIENERPYNIELKNHTWIVTGSVNTSVLDKFLYRNMPKFGGGFEISIKAKDGSIINVTHYK